MSSASPSDSGGRDRRGLAIGLALLLACGSLVGYGVLDSEEKAEARSAPTAEVTYEVLGEGTADITYLATGESEKASVAENARLPWKKTVHVPVGQSPIVSVVLGEKGGRASCNLSVRGKHVQRSTIYGPFGRGTCTVEPPVSFEGAQ
ncbi:hypothetical protein [Streptomyces sp. NPDC054975]